mmetsp:Transcript_74190/g.143608  ORF Transcript_74190/g.143608 Transcript_74190/m.143608 type:complete len:564 (+) Transcript_74190:48-1739(+)
MGTCSVGCSSEATPEQVQQWRAHLWHVAPSDVPKLMASVPPGLRKNRSFMLAAVMKEGHALEHADGDLKSDRALVLAAVRSSSGALRHAHESLHEDEEIVLAAEEKQELDALEEAACSSDREFVRVVRRSQGWTFALARESLDVHKQTMLDEMQQKGFRAIQPHINTALFSDREFMLTAVQLKGCALELASDDLKCDRELLCAAMRTRGVPLSGRETLRVMLLKAICKDGFHLVRPFLTVSMLSDRDFMFAIVKMHGWALQFAHESLKSDRGLVLAAVKTCGDSFRYACKELRSDREFVLLVVKEKGSALQYAEGGLTLDKEIALTAIREWALFPIQFYEGTAMFSDRDFVLEVVKVRGWAIQHADKRLKSDMEIALAAANCDGFDAIQPYIDRRLFLDRRFVMRAVQMSGRALQHAALSLRADREVIVAAVNCDGFEEVLPYIDASLFADREFVVTLAQMHRGVLQHACPKLKSDLEVVFAAINCDGFEAVRPVMNPALFSDRVFMLRLVQKRGEALKFASLGLRSDYEVVHAAVENAGSALQFADPSLRSNSSLLHAAKAH